MSTQVMDGRALAQVILDEIKDKTRVLVQEGLIPGLAIILVGDHAVSHIYVRTKVRTCHEVGFYAVECLLPSSTTTEELIQWIERFNQDDSIHGVIVQLPLPPHIDYQAALWAVDLRKDVDGLHPHNVGALVLGYPNFIPCTPCGILHMLASARVNLRGAHVTMIGASNIVGKPMAMLCLREGATVTLCHSRTVHLAMHTLRADIVIVAVGVPKLLTAPMVREGGVIIDVGTNQLPDGSLVGDVDFLGCCEKARWITPVPGGVGPVTVAMLLKNTLQAAQKQQLAHGT